ncbi:hypothetical protein VNI00_010607 [Paramarasmius palmivorus]|uniref:F-box domain-containing protein n=1 Tax=Paramarasmius palmivorus TaxID=297713 RepID=A0AAW0CJ77_9AGAR
MTEQEEIDLEESSRLSLGLRDLVRSGQLPSVGENLYIDHILSKLGESTGNILSEIKRLQAILPGIRKMRKTILSLHSPIRRLPPEILSAILVFAAALNGGERLRNGKQWSSAGIELGSVRSYWEQVVNATPEIWNMISIEVVADSIAPPDAVIQQLQSSLSHSQGIPMTLEISSLWPGLRELPGEQLRSLMELHLPRVWYLRLVQISPSAFLRNHCGLLNRVQVLHLSGDDFHTDVPEPAVLNTIGQCVPNIRHLDVLERPGTFPQSIRFDATFPLRNLTDLMLKYESGGETDGVLAAINCLRNLGCMHIVVPHLASNEVHAALDTRPTCFDLVTLSRLTIESSCAPSFVSADQDPFAYCTRILNAVSAPSLTSFTVIIRDVQSEQSETLPAAIENFLRRSNGCMLQDLGLHGVPIDDDHVISLLKSTPELKRLMIKETSLRLERAMFPFRPRTPTSIGLLATVELVGIWEFRGQVWEWKHVVCS